MNESYARPRPVLNNETKTVFTARFTFSQPCRNDSSVCARKHTDMVPSVDLLWGTVYNPRNGHTFMKRLLLALLPWMAMTSAVRAQAPADVVFTHHGVVSERCVRVDDECFVPLSFLEAVGWTYVQKGENVEIRAEGERVRVTLRDIAGTAMIPLRFAMEKLGGETSWDGDRLTALAPLSVVQIKRGRFTIQSNFAVKPKLTLMDNPNRVVLDIQGAKLSRRTNVDLDGTARIGQFKPDVVRVVLETNFVPQVNQRKFEVGKSFEFDVTGGDAEVKQPDPTSQELARPLQTGPKIPLNLNQEIKYDPASNPDMVPIVQVSGAATVGPLILDSEGERISELTLKIGGRLAAMPTFRRPEVDVIEIVLRGARVAEGVDFELAKGPTIRSAYVREESGAVVLALGLARPMGVEFSMSANGLQIQFIKPDVGNGRLAGKTVVVDAGHGGHDAGTQSAGISEKNLTLTISKILSKKLANEGATVIMTRKTDVFIPLNERPAIANRNGADFFVSIHINSNEIDNTASGSITFFHAKDAICQLLGDCIQREIVKVSGLPGMGVWSDQRIYQSGFAVLRPAKMPAVLVECGFLNTRKDRARMLTEDFHDAVASAIVKGLKAYLGDEGKKN
jgi:N-acetylmuramoyl-L-alanine amidase